MVPHKACTITDYFNTSPGPLPQKRPFPNVDTEDSVPAARGISSSLTPLPTQESDSDFSNTSHSRKTPDSQIQDERMPSEDSRHHGPSQDKKAVCTIFEQSPTKTPAVSSSQRVVRKGEVMIRNSDDESDSDASSLEDLDEILNRNRGPPVISASELPYLSLEIPAQEANNRKRSKRRLGGAPSPLPVRPASKFSLQVLGQQSKDFGTSKENVARTQDLLNVQQQKQERRNFPDSDLVDQVMQDHRDVDDIGRLKTAIQRTESMHGDQTWSFFHAGAGEKPSDPTSFPSIEDDDLCSLLCISSTRQQTILSGFIEHYARKGPPPEELLLWLLDSSFSEPRNSLRQAYIDTFRDSSELMTNVLTVDWLDATFGKMGASTAALEVDQTVRPSATSLGDLHSKTWRELFTMMDFLGTFAHLLSGESRVHAITLLCRLLLDERIINNASLISNIDHALTNLLGWPPDEVSESQSCEIQLISMRLYHSAKVPSLRVQLLRSLPILSPDWISLRHRLALAFLFNCPSYLPKSSSIPFSLDAVSAHLSTSAFNITNDTDYATLSSSITILDIAIDSANRPPNLKSFSEKAFNDSIDALAAKIKSMFMQIIDSGAANMRRTEAKEVLEGLHSRLVYAVRTKPPPKKMIFGDEEGAYREERKTMQAFLGAAQSRDHNPIRSDV